jgi:hypothetical protein
MKSGIAVCILAFGNVAAFAQSLTIPWSGYAHDPQHTAVSATAAQALNSIHWQTPVDMNPPSGGDLYTHYGSLSITAANTVLVPVTTASGGYQIGAFNGATGAAIYTLTSDYTPPAHNWTPPYTPALALGARLFYAGANGSVYYRDLPNAPKGPNGSSGAGGQFYFYTGTPTSAIQISTPLTADRSGNIYFGFIAGTNSLGIVSGLARISYTGKGTWVSATSLANNDSSVAQVSLNCAPALSNDQKTVYVAVSGGSEFDTNGYLVSANSTTLAPVAHVALYDPATGNRATVSSDSSAAPMIGPDGDVYYGVLETPCCYSHNDRGWMLHFDSTLATKKTPGSFGWDNTASVVPAASVPTYTGTSSYLILTKYNNYVGIGTGTGVNQVGVLDPNATMSDEYCSNNCPVTVMREVITVTGVGSQSSVDYPNAVTEWCINTTAIDPYTKAAVINSEDGWVYRWDFTTNSLLQRLKLTGGRGEAYTPTAIGPDGTMYAINDAILFAVGN